MILCSLSSGAEKEIVPAIAISYHSSFYRRFLSCVSRKNAMVDSSTAKYHWAEPLQWSTLPSVLTWSVTNLELMVTSMPHQSNKIVSVIWNIFFHNSLGAKFSQVWKIEQKKQNQPYCKLDIIRFTNCSLKALGLTLLSLISNLHDRLKLYVVVIAEAI